MPIELTLRKISKLISKIDSSISDTYGDLQKLSVSVVIHDSQSSIQDKVLTARKDWRKSVDNTLSLMDARVTLRSVLGSANQSAGINHIVTELRGLEHKADAVRRAIRMIPAETVLDDTTLDARISARIDAIKNTTIDVSGYGAQRSDTMSLPILEEADLERLESLQKQYKNQMEQLQDKLEQLNSSVAIEIPDDVVDTLQKLEIIN